LENEREEEKGEKERNSERERSPGEAHVKGRYRLSLSG
jgi:hypothetical protein